MRRVQHAVHGVAPAAVLEPVQDRVDDGRQAAVALIAGLGIGHPGDPIASVGAGERDRKAAERGLGAPHRRSRRNGSVNPGCWSGNRGTNQAGREGLGGAPVREKGAETGESCGVHQAPPGASVVVSSGWKTPTISARVTGP